MKKSIPIGILFFVKTYLHQIYTNLIATYCFLYMSWCGWSAALPTHTTHTNTQQPPIKQRIKKIATHQIYTKIRF